MITGDVVHVVFISRVPDIYNCVTHHAVDMQQQSPDEVIRSLLENDNQKRLVFEQVGPRRDMI